MDQGARAIVRSSFHKQLGDACSTCERIDVEFTANKYQCVECRAIASAKAFKKNPAKELARVRAWTKLKAVQDPTGTYLKNKSRGWRWSYGLTDQDVVELVSFQRGLCPICRQPLREADRQRQIEHDHSIMPTRGRGSIQLRRASVRGVTCGSCNLMLGHAHDDIQTLRNAIAYLERAQSLKLLGAGAADCFVVPFDFVAFATDAIGDPYASSEEPMIAAIETPGELHIVLHVGRKALHVQVTTYCSKQFDASSGTVQVPDRVFNDKIPWKQVSPGSGQGSILVQCQKCLVACK